VVTIFFSPIPIICPPGFVSLCGSDINSCTSIKDLNVCTFPGQTSPFREVCYNETTNEVIIVEYEIDPRQNLRTLEFCLNGIMNIQATIIGGGAGGGAGNQFFTAGGGSTGVINNLFFSANGQAKLYYVLGGGGFGGTFVFNENNHILNSNKSNSKNDSIESNSNINSNKSNTNITNSNTSNINDNTVNSTELIGNNNITSVNGCATILQTDQGVQYKALGGVAGQNGVSSNGQGGRFPNTEPGRDGNDAGGGLGGRYLFSDLNNAGDGGNGGDREQSGQNGQAGAIILRIVTLTI